MHDRILRSPENNVGDGSGDKSNAKDDNKNAKDDGLKVSKFIVIDEVFA